MATSFVEGYADCLKHGRYTIVKNISSHPSAGPYTKDGWEHSVSMSGCPGCAEVAVVEEENRVEEKIRQGAPWTFSELAGAFTPSLGGLSSRSWKDLEAAGLQKEGNQYVLPARS